MAKILVIDDEEMISSVIKMVLELDGYQVDTAPTAEDGIDKIIADPPDLIFLDINMPGKGGLAVANELARKKLKIPFILSTASVLDDPVEAYELFVVRHLYVGTLKKPMEIELIGQLAKKGLDKGKEIKNQPWPE